MDFLDATLTISGLNLGTAYTFDFFGDRQVVGTGDNRPEVKVNGLSGRNSTASVSRRMRAVVSAASISLGVRSGWGAWAITYLNGKASRVDNRR